jgi:hypothetical protein
VSEPTPAGGQEPPVTPDPAVTPAAAPEDAVPARGMRAIEADSFSLAESVGGVRGAVESGLPGRVLGVVLVACGHHLRPPP